MQPVDGRITIKQDETGLSLIILNLAIMIDAIFLAYHCVKKSDPGESGGNVAVELSVMAKVVRMPLCGPYAAALEDKSPVEIEVLVEDVDRAPNYATWTGGFNGVILSAVSLALANLYDSVLPRIVENHGKKTAEWPTEFLFLRHVRNAIAHGGSLHITSKDAPPATWRGKTYQASDSGTHVIGPELCAGDLIALMLDAHAEVMSW